MSSGGVATAPPAPAASSDHADAAADSTAGSSSSASTDSSSSAAAASSSSYVPIREVATKVHESLANSNYSVVRLGTAIADTLSSTALSFVPTPVKTTAVSLSNPLIDAADTQLEHAFNRLQPVRAEVSKQVASLSSAFNRHTDEAQRYFMPAEWFAQVDEVMASGKSAQQLVRLRQSDLQPVLQTFYVAAAYQFLSLVRRGQSGLQPFLDSLRQEMEKVWTDTLEGPATTFFDAAMRVYREAGSRARDLTSKTLIDKVKPLLGEQYETEVMHAYQAGNVTNSQLVYISSLQLFKQLQDRLKQKKLQADALQAEFLAAMKDKLGSAYNSGLEAKLTELISTWTEAVRERKKTIGDNIFDKYQYLLLSAQQVFDKVLPPVMSSEEDEEKKEESKEDEEKDDAPNTLADLASHVKDRIGERGVVSNVTTASSNSVKESVNVASQVAKEGVALAGNVAQRAVQTASNVVRPVVDPVVARVQPIVQPIVQPYMDKAMPVVDGVKKELTARQQQIADAIQQSLQATKAHVESVQQYITALTKQTGEKVLAAANDTKTSLTASASSAASSLHSSLPPAIRSRVEDLQQRLASAVQYASQLRQDGQLQQQVKELSISYAGIVSEQLHAIGGNLNADKLGQLVEDARTSVSQLILYTKKQLALEQGRDESEVDDESSTHCTSQHTEEQKSSGSSRQVQ